MSMMTLDMKNITRKISDDGKTLEVFIPMQLKRRAVKKKSSCPTATKAPPNKTFHW